MLKTVCEVSNDVEANTDVKSISNSISLDLNSQSFYEKPNLLSFTGTFYSIFIILRRILSLIVIFPSYTSDKWPLLVHK